LSLAIVLDVTNSSAHGAARPKVLQLGLSFSADSTKVATCGDHVRVFAVPSGERLREIDRLWEDLKWTRQIAFSPTQPDLLAVGKDDDSIRILRLGQKAAVHELKAPAGMCCGVAYSADGRSLASVSTVLDEGRFQAGAIRIWDPQTGKLKRSIDREGCHLGAVALSRDGSRIAFCAGPVLEVFETTTWEQIGSVKLPMGDFAGEAFGISATFLRDEERLVVAGGVGTADRFPSEYGVLWDIDMNRSATLWDRPRHGYLYAVGSTPEGGSVTGHRLDDQRQVVIRRNSEAEVVWQTDSVRGKDNPGDVYGVCMSPDGKWVGWCDGDEVCLANATTGELVSVFQTGDRTSRNARDSLERSP